MWKATIQDLIDNGMTLEEVKQSLLKRYPGRDDIVALIPQVTSTIKGFCKKGQDFGFGYNNPGPSNYNIPQSVGEPGGGLGQIDPTSATTPSSSYTDRVRYRLKLEKEKQEQEKRREKRKEVVDKMAATKPGESLTNPEGVKPGETLEGLVENMKGKIENISRTFRTEEKTHEISPQWTEKEQRAQEVGMGPTPTSTSIPQAPTKALEDVSKTTDQVSKKVKDTVDKSQSEAKKLNETTKQVQDSIDKLNKSLQNLGH